MEMDMRILMLHASAKIEITEITTTSLKILKCRSKSRIFQLFYYGLLHLVSQCSLYMLYITQ